MIPLEGSGLRRTAQGATRSKRADRLQEVVGPAGIEPATLSLEG
jgi:hypothetical protein